MVLCLGVTARSDTIVLLPQFLMLCSQFCLQHFDLVAEGCSLSLAQILSIVTCYTNCTACHVRGSGKRDWLRLPGPLMPPQLHPGALYSA
eukprot:6462979-Amphidinium_carterae.2